MECRCRSFEFLKFWRETNAPLSGGVGGEAGDAETRHYPQSQSLDERWTAGGAGDWELGTLSQKISISVKIYPVKYERELLWDAGKVITNNYD